MLRDDTSAEERIGSRDLTHWRTPAGRRLASWVVRQAVGLARWSAAHVVLVVTALVGGAAAVALTAVAAEVYDAVVEADGIAGLDQPVLDQAIVVAHARARPRRHALHRHRRPDRDADRRVAS